MVSKKAIFGTFSTKGLFLGQIQCITYYVFFFCGVVLEKNY